MKKVFISYNKADRQWAEWIGWHLEENGYRAILQAWDFMAGSNFVLEMQKASTEADHTVAVLSGDYLAAFFTHPEWAAAFARDPKGEKGILIPVRVRECDVEGILGTIIYIDLVGLEKEQAVNRLIEEMKRKRRKPDTAPDFPGTTLPPEQRTVTRKPSFPMDHITLSRLPVTDANIFGREKEVVILDEAWKGGQTNIVTLIAWGGVGKTALVNHWLKRMAVDGFRGAEKVYGWSFYSQGAAEGKQASADEFMQETLRWFGDHDPTAGLAEEKGRRLAALIRKSKTLLVLDGMEPLQYPPSKDGSNTGRLKDAGLRTLLKELAVSQPGLCVVTTREAVTDLSVYGEPAVKRIALEHLSPDAGTALLRHQGSQGRKVDMREAVEEYGGHALALTLLGKYLCMGYDGDVRKRDTIGELIEEPGTGEHAKRMMQAYRHWLGESAELDILYIMGLFDRPAELGAIEVLKTAPAIAGLTERLVGISPVKWNYAVNRLRELGLLAKEEGRKSGGLDCHPLVREYFGERLKEENPGGWKEAHTRLYEYYRKLPGKELPDTLEEMSPLFSAVAHGCLAGRHQEAMDVVYEKRICRGDDAFIVKKLGAFSADLSALSHFFDVPWCCLASGLSEGAKANVLSWSAFGLHSVGRLREAIQPWKISLEMGVQQEDWKGAAIDASNLSELLLTLGDVSGSVAAGRESVTYADRSGDWGQQMMSRTTLADALHQWGRREEAEGLFREAEEMQRTSQPEFHFLYGPAGFQFCDLLLELGKDREMMERAEATLEWVTNAGLLLDIALDHLTLGRAWMECASKKKGSDPDAELWTRARHSLDRAITGLREAQVQDYLVRGLFARAACSRLRGEFASAWADLSEALEIAEAGGMKLHLCDYHIDAARLCAAEGKKSEAAEHERKAAELIESTGYYRRKKEEL